MVLGVLTVAYQHTKQGRLTSKAYGLALGVARYLLSAPRPGRLLPSHPHEGRLICRGTAQLEEALSPDLGYQIRANPLRTKPPSCPLYFLMTLLQTQMAFCPLNSVPELFSLFLSVI